MKKGIILSVLATVVFAIFAESIRAQCSSFNKVTRGASHGIGLKSNGTLWAWGNNNMGQLGNGNKTNHDIPVQINTFGIWTDITAGNNYGLALKSDGSLWAWGENDHGQLGDGSNVDRFTPIQIGTGNNWASVTSRCYSKHTLGIKNDGSLWAWGKNDIGQLGNGTNTGSFSPIQIGIDTWTSVSTGAKHSVGIKSDGSLWAWGWNAYGQLGDGTYANRKSPVQISSSSWTSVTAGAYITLGIKNDGTLWAWGWNAYGELGDGTTTLRNTPVQIGTANNWASVTAGAFHTHAIKNDGTLWAWGHNDDGQLGDGTYLDKHAPVQIGAAINWVSVIAGAYSTHGIKMDNSHWAWGANDSGEIGNGTVMANKNTPTRTLEVCLFASTAKLNDANCGLANGNACVVASTGPAPYTYSWTDGTNVIATTDTLSNVVAGTYSVTVTDASLATTVASVVIDPGPAQPTSNTINVTENNSYTSPSNNYTWTTSGVYMDTLINAVGCDSILTINLTINSSNIVTGLNSNNSLYGSAVNEKTTSVVSKLYPNPNSGHFTINVHSPKEVKLGVRIFDISGRMIQSAGYQLLMGHNEMDLDVSKLINGIYFIQVLEDQQLIFTSKVRKE